MTTLINCTPHSVAIYRGGGVVLTLPASPTPARLVDETTELAGEATDGGLVRRVMVRATGELRNVPDAAPGVLYVVSRILALAAPARRDLVYPAEPVRDEHGRIVGCAALGSVPAPGPEAAE